MSLLGTPLQNVHSGPSRFVSKIKGNTNSLETVVEHGDSAPRFVRVQPVTHTPHQSLQEYNQLTRCQSQRCSTVGGESAQEHGTSESPHAASTDVQLRPYRPTLQLGQHHSTHHSNHITSTFVSLTS